MWAGHNGDHAYYTAMELQYGEVDYDRSLRSVAQYFDYPDWSRSLDYGFPNPVGSAADLPSAGLPAARSAPGSSPWHEGHAQHLSGLAAGGMATIADRGSALPSLAPN